MTEKQFRYEEMGIDASALSREMGYGSKTADAHVLAAMLEVMNEVVASPRCSYVVHRGAITHDTLSAEGVTLHIGPTIAKQLSGSEAFAFFVATAGVEFEQYQASLRDEGDSLRIFIADAMGSLLAERCAEAMERVVQHAIDKLGWHHTNRFSPGYCSWPLTDQPLLFSLLGDRPSGVRLLESHLMLPIKSVSGVMGLGRHVERLEYACQLCGKKDCFLRI